MKRTQANVKIPQPPKHLREAGRNFWKSLLTTFDIPFDLLAVLEAACVSLDRAEAAREMIESEGLIAFDRFNQQKPHPACVIERDARGLFLRALKQLGITDAVDHKLLTIAKARK